MSWWIFPVHRLSPDLCGPLGSELRMLKILQRQKLRSFRSHPGASAFASLTYSIAPGRKFFDPRSRQDELSTQYHGCRFASSQSALAGEFELVTSGTRSERDRNLFPIRNGQHRFRGLVV